MAKANPFGKKAATAKVPPAKKAPAAKAVKSAYGKGGKGMVAPPARKAK